MYDLDSLARLIASEGQEVTITDSPTITDDGVTDGISRVATLSHVSLTGPEWEELARHLIQKHENGETK